MRKVPSNMAYRRRYYGRARTTGKDRFGHFTTEQAKDTSTAGLVRKHFTGVNEYLGWIDAERKTHNSAGSYMWQSTASTYGGDEWNAKAGHTALTNGDLARGQRFADMSDAFGEEIYVERRVWYHSVAGAFPDVGAYLNGRPDNMWNRRVEHNDRDPIRIWVGLTSSGGVTPADLEKRGAAICAFAIALSVRRQVILTPYVNLGGAAGTGAIVSFDLENPLNLSEIAAAIATPSVTRGLGIYACYLAQPLCHGSWWRDYDNPERMREQLGCAENDVYLGSIHLYDELLKDPIKWINENLSHLLSDNASDDDNNEEGN